MNDKYYHLNQLVTGEAAKSNTFVGRTAIKNAKIVDRFETEIMATDQDHIVEAIGMHLLPRTIDEQVHFREPGLTHKGTIPVDFAPVNLAPAVAGGIISFMEMASVRPSTACISSLLDAADAQECIELIQSAAFSPYSEVFIYHKLRGYI